MSGFSRVCRYVFLVVKLLLVKLHGEDMNFTTFDALLSMIEREVLISDKLASVIKIVLEGLGVGLWRLRTDPQIG